MSDIIHLLPDSVANQIAAGEVVQRPASVVKELVENAIDAGATEITVSIIDAGRTLIQVSDNGVGMSETDARMAFERHATSKIQEASDIFKIRSMGFRGEALASIAAVSQTDVKTRKKDSEVGTHIVIAGSKVELQELAACPQGTTFAVKNLFFNTPARRKFLKSNKTEFNYILSELYQTAIANPQILFTIMKDGDLYAKYPIGTLIQRITSIFGRQMEKALLSVEDDSGIVKISGYVGVPEMARKTNSQQYFFVNNRFFRQKSFLGAVMRAYGNLIQAKEYPPFFLFLEIDPAEIDVNIHPTKTEIKFSEEYNISQLLEAAVRYTLGKNNVVPSLDFSDDTNYSDMFTLPESAPIVPPTIHYDPSYNPFKQSYGGGGSSRSEQTNVRNWEKLFEDYQNKHHVSTVGNIEFPHTEDEQDVPVAVQFCVQYQKKYIIAYAQEKFYIIDIKRAHYRLLYDRFTSELTDVVKPSQKTLLPVRIDITADESETLKSVLPQLRSLGFDIEEFGQNSFVVNGVPADVDVPDIEEIIQGFLTNYEDSGSALKTSVQERLARSMARSASLFRNPTMSEEEMKRFVTQLLGNSSFSITPEGQIATIVLEPGDFIKKFN